MKVLLINGSPHKEGCVFTALSEVAGELNKDGIDTEIFHIGTEPVRGCIACRQCMKLGKCVFDDVANEIGELMLAADGVIIGSPVYYAGANGALCALLDRAFFSAAKGGFAGKPAAAVVSCRRGGAGSAFDRLNKYFTINGMPVVSSQYWNAVHGSNPEQVRQDLEGLQIMRTLGRNMAWLLRSIEAGALPLPEREPQLFTNFIR
jgi:multimeric flavodoxin WrbA